MSILKPFQLLELNIISAQDLSPVSRKMKTYAVVWVHQEHKLTTQVDSGSHNNPTWNDKFVFRVTDEFLRSDTSAITVEIYALNWLRDVHVGKVRILVGNLIPPLQKRSRPRDIGMNFAALQVWRQSGRPQGILNVGVAVLDSSMRSMPLYSHLSSSAVGYRDLHDQLINNHNKDIILDTAQIINNNNDSRINPNKPVLLRRTRSDQSEFDRKPTLEEELLQVASEIASSMMSGSEIELIKGKRIRKLGSETGPVKVGRRGTQSNPGSVLSATSTSDVVVQGPLLKVMYRRASGSMLSASEVENPVKKGSGDRNRKQKGSELGGKSPGNGGKTKSNRNNDQIDPSVKSINEKAVAFRSPRPQIDIQQLPKIEFGSINKQFFFLKNRQKGPTIATGKLANGSIISISDVGPSPSEVAAEVARRRYLMSDEESSIMDEWSLDESVEGLRSKLDRWQLEPPMVFDRGGKHMSYPSSTVGRTTEVLSKSGGRHSDAGESSSPSGAFTCFSMIFGYECSCVCGKPPASVIEGHPDALHAPLVHAADQFYRATPGRFGTTPGRKGTTPGRIGATPGRIGATPGRNGATPGRLGAAPGRLAG